MMSNLMRPRRGSIHTQAGYIHTYMNTNNISSLLGSTQAFRSGRVKASKLLTSELALVSTGNVHGKNASIL